MNGRRKLLSSAIINIKLARHCNTFHVSTIFKSPLGVTMLMSVSRRQTAVIDLYKSVSILWEVFDVAVKMDTFEVRMKLATQSVSTLMSVSRIQTATRDNNATIQSEVFGVHASQDISPNRRTLKLVWM